MNEPTLDDVKRFERKVYIFCIFGMIVGAVIVSLLWEIYTPLAKIGRIAGYALIVLGILMINYFFGLFKKIKSKLKDPFWKPEDGLDDEPKTDQDNQK